ncbi:UDP-N-acetyl-D-mannosamine dehydrogenase [Planktomarina temperata]|nr:UDP-N-acetyl-D-mannosamine dehydrogenase [Planktomarina temperata]
MQFENISVIGLGYIGLPTAAMFASCGANVIGVDVSPYVVENVNRGDIHIVEPGLKELVHRNVENGNLKAKYQPEAADAFLIAVPTPFKTVNNETPEPDLGFIREACVAIAPVLRKGNLIVLESTSPVGTTEKMCEWLSELRPDLNLPSSHKPDADILVAYCPERVLPGQVIHELIHNDRIIGGITPKCSEAATFLYKKFLSAECYATNARTAEMVKLTENASRDVQIAFANELSLICDEQNINVWDLITLANKHPRVNILQPGTGVGGHCIAVDPWFIVDRSPENSKIIRLARERNNQKTEWVIEKIATRFSQVENVISEKCNITLFGVAFKPNIDDLRESPAIKIAKKLQKLFPGRVQVVDPNISALPNDLKNLSLINISEIDLDKGLNAVLVGHKEFLDISFTKKNTLDFVGIFRK